MATAYDYIEKNKRRSCILVALFPVSFTLFMYVGVLVFYMLIGMLFYTQPNNIWSFGSLWNIAFTSAHDLCKWLLPLCFVCAVFWAWQAWKQGDQMILDSLPSIRSLEKWDALETYELLENLCIASGDYLPQLYVLEDNSMNAFSVGMNPMRAGIILSSGLLARLDRRQMEGVLAHELAHIRQYDTRLMVIMITCLAFFTFAGEMLFYGTEKDKLDDSLSSQMEPLRKVRIPLVMYVGGILICYGYFIAPLLRFALSRTREYLADAQAVLLTRYPKGLAGALWKISDDSRLEALNNNSLLGTMCIACPTEKENLFGRLSGAGRTHPPIEDRIRTLRDMDGGEGLFWD